MHLRQASAAEALGTRSLNPSSMNAARPILSAESGWMCPKDWSLD